MDFTLLKSWWATVEASIGRITVCLELHHDSKPSSQAASTVKYQQWPYPDYYIFKNAETRLHVVCPAIPAKPHQFGRCVGNAAAVSLLSPAWPPKALRRTHLPAVIVQRL